MEFRAVTAEDKEIINKYLRQEDSRSCDLSFSTIYLWREIYEMAFAECEGTIVFRSSEDERSFSFPIGAGDKAKAIEAVVAYCEKRHQPVRWHSLSRQAEAYLEGHYPGEYEIIFHPHYADYIYEVSALSELRGKKYHGKKNHINYFKKTFDWSYEKITEENVEECLSMLEQWKKENCDPEDIEKHEEVCISKCALRMLDELDMVGGLLRADGRVVAFSIGEKINSDTFNVHIEKAYAEVRGAYPMINQQFLLHEAQDCRYVNREEDNGEEGLRQAKLSYHPAFLLEKGSATRKKDL